jgi:nucleoside-diphosphate-sugar epimerase
VPLVSSGSPLLKHLFELVITLSASPARKREQSCSVLKKVSSTHQQQLIHLIILFNLVIPIIGEIDKPADWVHVVKDLDAVIETVGAADMKTISPAILSAISNAAKELRPQGTPKLTYIYTSGTWVHGDNRTDIVTDSTPITSPPELVAWRPHTEQAVINDKVLNGVVIRPAVVYGRSGSVFAPFFKSASEGNVWYPGTPGGRFALIHTDDLAKLFVKAVERPDIVGGLIFDAVNDQTESADDFLATLVKVSGATKPYEYRKPTSRVFFSL